MYGEGIISAVIHVARQRPIYINDFIILTKRGIHRRKDVGDKENAQDAKIS